MSVRFKCPHCQAVLQARETDAGKKAKCKHCQTKMLVPSPRPKQSLTAGPSNPTNAAAKNASAKQAARRAVQTPHKRSSPAPSKPETPPEPNRKSVTPTAIAGDDAFGALPEFHSVDQVVAKPQRPDDDFRNALAQSHLTSASDDSDADPSTSHPNSQEDVSFNEAGASVEDMVAAAVRRQQQRNKAAIAAKITVPQIRTAFRGDLEHFDAKASVGGNSWLIALAVLTAPIVFSIGVVLVTMAMVALPLGWLPIDFATAMQKGGLIWYPLAWCLLFAAWIPVCNLLFATLGILLSGAEESESTRTLTAENQPVMFEFVSLVCQKVGAPAPTRIDLDTGFNASASFRRGWASFGKDDLVLTLGIPLIACQNTSQLASVLAHEFGHFRQGSAMRSNYLIRMLTGWFIHKAQWGHARAQLIEYYQDSEDSNDSLLAIISFIGYAGRQMMLAFGYAGHALAGSLSREMEYDADRHAVHLAGTKHFVESMAMVERYGIAHSVTIENLRMLYQSAGVLVDNIPRLMLHIGKTMPIDVVRRIADQTQKEKQESLDTHPPTRDRVNAAKELNQPGIFDLQRPAIDLIQNWPATCQECTIDFYAGVLDRKVSADQLTPIEEVLTSEHKLLLDKK